ncbi:Translocation protein SEC62 [Nakaseomyces bracarensis]|uniref:Translocation protein SEC62 n=1 Tax=Nakaseomyces bracarensis TaxID=273131 RepID=A0ABR4NU48_9SACH
MDPATLTAVAKFARHRKELKQRKGKFQDKMQDFFRYKRFARIFESDQYKKKSRKQPDLYPPMPEGEDEKDVAKREEMVQGIFIELIKLQWVVPVQKLHSYECKEHDLRPSKDFPHLVMMTQAKLSDDEYYIWNYNPKYLTDYLIVLAVISVILLFCCYPLWPSSFRVGAYYLSLSAIGFIGFFFATVIVRSILYVISLPLVKDKGGFWLFPNLLEDCGVLESFKPFYGFGEKDGYSYIKKMEKQRKRQAKKEKMKKLKETKIVNEKISEVKDEN